MNVSEQLLQILSDEGVKNIFGIAGDALNPLIDAIADQEQVKWVKVKHEGNASFAAFAQGALGELGVCASTVGPGALHLVNGLYNAKKERSPVLAITGQVPIEFIGTAYHQEVNLTKVFDDICDYQAVIRSPEEAPRVILRALKIAINNKAVCRIELPADIAEMPAANQSYVHKIHRSTSSIVPPMEEITELAFLLNNREKIGILAGAGCREAKDEVLDLARKIKAPITHTVRSSDIFDHETDQVVGLTGLIGNKSGYDTVMDSEVLIMLGTDFPYTDFLPNNTKIVQVDIQPENIGNRIPVDVGIHGDIKSVLTLLNPLIEEKETSDFLDAQEKEFNNWKKKNNELADPSRDMSPIHPEIIAKALSEIASDDAIFVADTGTSTIWSTNFMNFNNDRRLIGSFNHGSMAVGLPVAIGAQLLYPEREVWALVGDGSFNMSLHDLSTAVEYGLPIKIIVLNNQELGFVKIEMEEAGLAPNFEALKMKNIDFHSYADLCGGKGFELDKSEDVYHMINSMKNEKKPTVLNAHVTNGALSLPPKIGWKEASGFGSSKIKEIIKSIQGDKAQWENIKAEVQAYFN